VVDRPQRIIIRLDLVVELDEVPQFLALSRSYCFTCDRFLIELAAARLIFGLVETISRLIALVQVFERQ
jgi:hypothetical protein